MITEDELRDVYRKRGWGWLGYDQAARGTLNDIKTFAEGVSVSRLSARSLEELGLVTPENGELTEKGERFLSASTTETPGGSTPSQYALPSGAAELQDLIEHREMNFAVGNIFKAAYRLGHCDHSDAKRDLNRIIWFAQRELKRLE